jgi:Autographiviridae portal protein
VVPEATQEEATSTKARYESLKEEREPYLRRAREASLLTIPALVPPMGHTNATVLPTPFQSVGSDGVNSLASKLLLALLPPGSSFFRLTMDDFVVEKLKAVAGGGQAGEDARGEFEAALGRIERAVINRMEQVGARTVLFEALKHLLVAGNCLVQILPGAKMRLHYLDHYVVKRDAAGNVLEIIVWEEIAKLALPKALRDMVSAEEDEKDKSKTAVDVYTHIRLEDGKWKVHQELRGKIVPDSVGFYPKDKSAWIPLRYTRVDGEDYGRGRVEEYLGDFQSLESLSQSLVEGAAIAAKHVFLRREASTLSAKKLTEARNGEVIDGDVNDVGVLRVEKANDLSVAKSALDTIEERLQKSFMIAQQRDAERVTAEEVRAVVTELEKTLGGVYSILSQELQLPIVVRVMFQMEREGKLPPLPKDAVAPAIVTGLEALGRNSDLQKLREFIQETAAEFGPQAVTEYINVGAYMKRKATALQIDLKDLIRSEAEVQATRAQQQQAAMVAKLGGPAMQALKGQQGAPAPEAE